MVGRGCTRTTSDADRRALEAVGERRTYEALFDIRQMRLREFETPTRGREGR